MGIILFAVGYIGHLTLILYNGHGGVALTPIDFFNIFVILETLGLFIAFKYADVKMISSKIKPINEQKLFCYLAVVVLEFTFHIIF